MFATSRENLLRDKDSFFAAMFSGQGIKPEAHADGSYFIDRDRNCLAFWPHFHAHLLSATFFSYIINYLRTGALHLPPDAFTRSCVAREADFYNLRGMLSLMETMSRHQREEKAGKPEPDETILRAREETKTRAEEREKRRLERQIAREQVRMMQARAVVVDGSGQEEARLLQEMEERREKRRVERIRLEKEAAKIEEQARVTRNY